MRGCALHQFSPSVLLTTLLTLCASAFADTAVERVGWPDVTYDSSVPTLESVLGYAPGDQITSIEQAHAYLRALSEAQPARTRLIEYARSWEGRPLVYFLIGSEQTMSRLDEVKAGMQALADPAELSGSEMMRWLLSCLLLSGLPMGYMAMRFPARMRACKPPIICWPLRESLRHHR